MKHWREFLMTIADFSIRRFKHVCVDGSQEKSRFVAHILFWKIKAGRRFVRLRVNVKQSTSFFYHRDRIPCRLLCYYVNRKALFHGLAQRNEALPTRRKWKHKFCVWEVGRSHSFTCRSQRHTIHNLFLPEKKLGAFLSVLWIFIAAFSFVASSQLFFCSTSHASLIDPHFIISTQWRNT